MPQQDHYAVLGVSPDATDDEIRAAYKRAALRWHPDRCKDPDRREEFEREFKKAQQAHEVLSDPAARRRYDADDDDDGPAPFPQGGPWGFGCGMPQGFGDIFGDFWGDPLPPPPIEAELAVSLEDLYRGAEVQLHFTRHRWTEDLFGRPSHTVEEHCVQTVQLGAGWKSGTTLTYPGEGSQSLEDPDIPAGDLLVTIREKEHDRLIRAGSTLTLWWPYCYVWPWNQGKRVRLVDGSDWWVPYDGSPSVRLRGKGMPDRRQRRIVGYGDLVVPLRRHRRTALLGAAAAAAWVLARVLPALRLLAARGAAAAQARPPEARAPAAGQSTARGAAQSAPAGAPTLQARWERCAGTLERYTDNFGMVTV